ncbi:ABC transporter permease [Hyphobacterium sp.]|uniref:ABC transporter permease n=1 Tax=Hyphobacterium sp. TaxID=2004662 RepID=UPI003BAA1776
MTSSRGFIAIYFREMRAWFTTPLAYVFLAAFAFSAPAFAYNVGRFFDTNRADLAPLFAYLPWLLMILMPALAMRAWAEERDRGTLEIILSLPVSIGSIATAKFMAAWTVAAAALAATFPMWVAVNYLGSPDNVAILISYFGAFLLAGSYLAIGQALSAASGSQVTAFVLSVLAALFLTMSGLPLVTESLSGAAPAFVVEAIAYASVLERFAAFERGVISLPDVIYFLSLIALGVTGAGMQAGLSREAGR